MKKAYLLTLAAALGLAASAAMPRQHVVANKPATTTQSVKMQMVDAVPQVAGLKAMRQAPAKAPQAIADYTGTYNWAWENGYGDDYAPQTNTVSIEVTDAATGDAIITMDQFVYAQPLQIKAKFDLAAGTLSITPNHQYLGIDEEGYENWFDLCGVNNDGSLYLDASAGVGTINGGTITFPEMGVWTVEDEDGYGWQATYMNVLTLQEPEDPNADPNEGWTSLGLAHFTDAWVIPAFTGISQYDPEYQWEVELQQNIENPNMYRLVDPYTCEGCPLLEVNKSTDAHGYIQFDATDPAHVLFSNVSCGFANANVGAKMYCHDILAVYLWNNPTMTAETIIGILGDQILYTTFDAATKTLTIPSTVVDGVGANAARFGIASNPTAGYSWQTSSQQPINMGGSIQWPADEPTGVTVVFQPAAGELINGANYYIFDNNTIAPVGANARYGFFADQGAVKGVMQMPEQAYANKSITSAIYVWTAMQKEDNPDQWYFVNKSTGRYISNSNNASATEIGYVTMEQYPGMNNTYFRLTNVSTGKQFDANAPGTIDLSWWQGTGHPIQFYAAVEDGDAWQLAANEEYSYTITCNFLLGEEILKTETVSGAPGQEYTFKAPQFYAGETISGVISKYNSVYNVACELALPFKASADLENATYQALAIHSTNYTTTTTPYTLTYNGEAIKAPATAKTGTEPYNDNQLFALIGSYADGFKLYSKGAEQYVIAAANPNVDVTLGDEENATVWQVKASRTNAGEQFFCLLNGATANQYMNLNAPQARVSEWTDNDNGSTMWAYGVSQPVVNTYAAFFANAANVFAGNDDMLEIVAEGQALVDALDPWSELTEEQIAAIDAVKAQIEVAVYRQGKKNDILKYFEASYSGKEDAPYFAATLDTAETTEEVDAAYAELLNTAMAMFQSDFENGAVLKNKRNGKYMTYYYTEEEDPNDDEQIIVTNEYRVNPAATMGAYFTAEFTDNGNSVAPADRTFYLYNVSSKTYLEAQAANNATVAPVADKAQAALLKVVAGNNGFQLMITNAPDANDDEVMVPNNYINSNQTDTGHIVTWQYANDGGGFWVAEQLPTFTQPVEVGFVGETTMGQYGMEEFSSIEAITVKVPVGAKATEIGTIRAYVYDEDYNEVVIYESSIVDALEGKEAAESNVKVSTWVEDEEGNMVEETQSYPADLYTIVLNPARTAAGEYHVDLDAASFSLTEGEEGEEVTLYSEAAFGWASINAPVEGFEIEVTPAAGEVVSIANITLNSYTGMQPNWNYTGERLTVTYLPGTDGAETIVALDGEGINAYDTFSWDDASLPYYTIPVNVTKEGQYTLIIPEGFFEDDQMAPNKETIVTWTVNPDASISEITISNADGKTYDLQGRRVVAPAKGNLYIINGVKTVVK